LTETTIASFSQLDLSKEILKAVEKMGFTEVTPVQQQTIPVMMAGQDIIALAPTGTGKTAAFGIPMLEYISLTDQRIQEVVLCPTRELALQIGAELSSLAAFIPEVRIAILYGGQPIAKQMTQLRRKPQIIVATPGRILDHMHRGTVKLDHVHTMVLDEADEMLKMGFVKDVTKIIEAAPPNRQLVMFSATTNPDVMTIAWKFQHDAVEITIPATKENRPQITQYVIASQREKKYDHLLYLLDADVYHRIMIFCNTKDMTQRLSTRLQNAGYSADCIHGDIKQSQRNAVMQSFRKGKFEILVATDVAARGIDVDDVEAVINYDLPNENEYYLHRIGRTGRAKKHGVSFSLVPFADSIRMDEILRYLIAKPIPLRFDEMGTLVGDDGEPFFENM
jgi:ATP-dependent RNA helicase DeaD